MAISKTSLTIDGNQTIGKILGGKIGLCVPPSQRSYRWKKEHVDTLYNDIHDNLLNDEYFLGSVVVVSSSDKQTFVFDGQQRIATTMILIAAIRDQFIQIGDTKTADLIESESLFSTDRETHERIPHFILNTEDQSFFFDRVILRADQENKRKLLKRTRSIGNENVVLPQSHKRIDDAAKAAATFVTKKIVASLPVSDASKRLNTWLNFIQQSLRAILVGVSDERTAFTIFETMNDRGLRLSAADLLKNRLYAIADKRQNEVIQKWQAMTAVLEAIEGQEEGVLEYIRCYWVANHGHTRTKDLYDKMKAKAQNAAQAVDLASQLERSTQDYAALLLASHEKWASWGANFRSKIETLKLLGVTQLRPVLLAALSRFTKKEFKLLLDACVSWSVRSLLGGVPSGSIEDYYSRSAHRITLGEVTTAAEVKAVMSKVIPDDARFKNAVKTATVAKHNVARYYLLAMQRCADNKTQPQYVPNPGDEITLEHILPENPNNMDWDHFSSEQKKQFLNRLGNEVLLTGKVNSALGNVAYSIKEPALKNSEYSLTKMAAGLSIWRMQDIDERQEKLADLAIKTWPL